MLVQVWIPRAFREPPTENDFSRLYRQQPSVDSHMPGQQLCAATLSPAEEYMSARLLRIVSVLVFVVSAAAMLSLAGDLRRKLMIQFNKHLLNPLALRLAARRPMYYGIVHHIGRRSGASYSTPVVVKLTPEGAVLPLPYGASTDWCRNVLKAGSCTVTLTGSDIAFTAPELISADAAEPLVPATTAGVWRRLGIKHYLRLTFGTAAPASPETATATA